jgi:hypothetical protein
VKCKRWKDRRRGGGERGEEGKERNEVVRGEEDSCAGVG